MEHIYVSLVQGLKPLGKTSLVLNLTLDWMKKYPDGDITIIISEKEEKDYEILDKVNYKRIDKIIIPDDILTKEELLNTLELCSQYIQKCAMYNRKGNNRRYDPQFSNLETKLLLVIGNQEHLEKIERKNKNFKTIMCHKLHWNSSVILNGKDCNKFYPPIQSNISHVFRQIEENKDNSYSCDVSYLWDREKEIKYDCTFTKPNKKSHLKLEGKPLTGSNSLWSEFYSKNKD